MARRCTTVPGLGTCCRALQQGVASKFTFVDSRGAERCASCAVVPSKSVNPKKRGRNVFQFRFLANSVCGIGPGGCPALSGGGGQQLQIPMSGGGTAPALSL